MCDRQWCRRPDGQLVPVLRIDLGYVYKQTVHSALCRRQELLEARWPNADPADLVHMPLAKAGAGSDANGLVATGAPPGDWTGALVLVLPGLQWYSYTRHVIAYDSVSQRLTFDKPVSEYPPALVPKQNSRYYLYGSLLALDSEGEWFLDVGAGKLYLWPSGGANPATLPLEIKQRTWAFDVTNQSYVEIAGFRTFAGAIRLNYANHCTVDGVRGEYVSAMRETNGWSLSPDVPTMWGDFNVWKNSVFAHSAASGLFVYGNDNLIANNVIHDVDTVALERAGIEFAAWLPNARNVIAYNTIFRSGWAGISMTGASNSRALYNRITDSALLVHYAGSLYAGLTDGQNSEIAWNEMSGAPCKYCTGVYLDDGTKNFVVHHNYLHDLAWFGATFKNQNAFFNNTVRSAGHSPFTMVPNYYTNTFEGISSAMVLNNLLDGSTGLKVWVQPTTVTDFHEFEASFLATPEWRHVVVPFSSLTQDFFANPVPLDLRVAQVLQFDMETPGDFDFEIDNVRLEGPTQKLLSDFELGLGSTLGTSWSATAGVGSNVAIQRGGPGAACSSGAAESTGTQLIYGWQVTQLWLSQSASGTADLSAYTGFSFDVRARSSFWLESLYQVANPVAPVQGRNYACPVDGDQVPITDCAIGKALPIGGYVAAGSDLGAFQSGVPRWKAGAQFSEDPASCTSPPDVVMNLPPAMPYPVTGVVSSLAPAFDASWHDSACTPNSTSLFVPVVLSLAGKNDSFYTSELTLANRGSATVSVGYDYVAFSGGGSGSSTSAETLGPGQQVVIPDVMARLRAKGVPIPYTGGLGGTLRLNFQGVSSPGDALAVVRTTTPVAAGRAGLAYAGVLTSSLLSDPVYICGLRQTSTDRSAIALQNAGASTDGDVTLRVSFFAGDGSTQSAVTTLNLTLSPGGFAQPALPDLGATGASFFARVDRIAGTARYYAYGVINDNGTNDGSFIAPTPVSSIASLRGITVPVVVEAGPYSTELILTNTTPETKEFRLTYQAAPILGGSTSLAVTVRPGEQRIIPAFVAFLRQQGAPGMASASGSLAGPLFATGNTSGLVVSARTWNPDPSGAGRYGLFYGGIPFGSSASDSAWIFGLQQDDFSRSNLALVNTGEVDGTSDTFRIELFSGDTGAKLGELNQDVAARGFIQLGQVLNLVPGGARSGFARITRMAGNNPFITYGVINDGATPGERSGDGAFVAMVPE